MSTRKEMKVGVVGAGAAGLCAIKQALSFGCDVIAFEQADKIGGLWNYSDEIDKDKNGLDIHSSMYRGLVTNVPKEIMNFPELPFETPDKSFIGSEDTLAYFHRYAEKFDLRKHIRFEHHVLRIRPISDDKWEFIVKDFKGKKVETFIFDAVLVCSGFPVPWMPKIPGQDLFKGKQLHSHFYRDARHYENENLLLIGSGPSGVEVVVQTGKQAKKLVWSNHMLKAYGRKMPVTLSPITSEKPDVKRLTENGAVFVDGSFEEFSVIIYATGYDYSFPFLSVDCGLQCHEKYVQPVYKHCININRPSMGIIGLPFFAFAMPLFDLQIRFCLTFMTQRKALPPRDEMLEDTDKEMKERWKKLPKHKAHFMGPERNAQYCEELARTAEIEAIKPVAIKIFDYNINEIFQRFDGFRNQRFKIIDDETFQVL